MRKALILFLTLVVLVSGGFLTAHILVNSQKEQVTWQEQTLYGDKSAVAGLKVTTQNGMDSSLLWNTTGVLGETLAPETDFDFSNQNHFSPSPITYRGIEIYPSYALYDLKDTAWMSDHTKEQMAGLQDFYQTCVDATPVNTEKSFILDVTEYLDYYPLEGWFDLPGYTTPSWRDSSRYDPVLAEAGRVFNEYFRIPIVGIYQLDFTVDKFYDNASMASGMSADYSPEFNGVVVGNTCYFTFNTVVWEDVYADCSLIPGGYGLYSFTFTTGENGNSTPDLSSLSTVYPLDVAEMFLELSVSADEKQLLLQTRDADRRYLTVIDIATMTCLQKLELGRTDDETYYSSRIEDDFITVFRYDYQQTVEESVTVLARQSDGTYRHAFTVPLNRVEFDMWQVLEYRGVDACELAYNGEYLVIAQNVYIMEDDRYRADTCDFYIAAYGPEGMAYAGQYHVSLTDVNNSNLAFPCDPFGDYYLQISWEQ